MIKLEPINAKLNREPQTKADFLELVRPCLSSLVESSSRAKSICKSFSRRYSTEYVKMELLAAQQQGDNYVKPVDETDQVPERIEIPRHMYMHAVDQLCDCVDSVVAKIATLSGILKVEGSPLTVEEVDQLQNILTKLYVNDDNAAVNWLAVLKSCDQ